MSKRLIDDRTVKPSDANITIEPNADQYNRYNITLPKSFSVYNDEGSVIYKGEVEKAANQLRAEIFGTGPVDEIEEVCEQPETKKKSKAKLYDKKRGLFLFIPFILALVILAAAVVGVFNVKEINEYVSMYEYKETGITILDPLFSFLKGKIDGFDLKVPTEFAVFKTGEEFADVFAAYALPIAIVLYALFMLFIFIVSIAGLAGKKNKDGFYRKAKLGYLSIVAFLCSLLIMVCGIYVSGGSIAQIVDFVTGKADFSIGYAMYALIAVPIITLICSCCAYRKYKEKK